MSTHTLKANKRIVFGHKLNSFRKTGSIPANIFGKSIESVSISVQKDAFKTVFKEAGETGIIQITIEGEDKNSHPVLISNIQIHPVTDEVLHIDFHEVNLKEKITASVPLEIEGESPAEKSGIGTLVQQMNEVEVEALPADLPEKIVVSVVGLEEVDSAIFVKDLKIDASKVTLVQDPDQIVVKVEPLQVEEEVAPVQTEVADGEAAGEKTEENKDSDSSEKSSEE